MRGRDGAEECWLRDKVVPVYDAMLVDPSRGRTAEQVAGRLRAHHLARIETAERTIKDR